MEDCLFCKMVSGEMEVKKVYEDNKMIIINDIAPKAPIHYLAIMKKHYKMIIQQQPSDIEDLGYCLNKIAQLTSELGLYGGYRLVINQGDDAGQSVGHLHVHILAGKKMDWNPA